MDNQVYFIPGLGVFCLLVVCVVLMLWLFLFIFILQYLGFFWVFLSEPFHLLANSSKISSTRQ